MKTLIGVEIHKDGNSLLSLVDIVAKNNSGKIKISPDYVEVMLEMDRLKFPASSKYLKITKECSKTDKEWFPSIFHISDSEDGKPYITLTWKEVYELTETEIDLINQENLS